MSLECVFRDKRVEIAKTGNSNIVMRGNRVGNLYILEGVTLEALVANTKASDNLERAFLWHKRVDHIETRELRELQKHSLIDKDISCGLHNCEKCFIAKKPNHHLINRFIKVKVVLHYIHSIS